MVFKPLRIGRKFLGALGSFQILEVYDGFPRGFHPKWVAVGLGKAINEIYQAFGLLQPEDTVFVERAKIACAVVFYEFVDDFYL